MGRGRGAGVGAGVAGGDAGVAGGGRTRIRTTRLPTPLGEVVAGATDAGVCLLEFAGRRALPAQLARLEALVGPTAPGDHPHTRALERELGEYFAGERREFAVPLVLKGTEFQERVWRTLRRIPYGATISYAELARRAECEGGVRAVGSANGANRIAIVVPCHRVIRTGGDLGGYGGGLHRKRRLLDLEAGTPQRELW